MPAAIKQLYEWMLNITSVSPRYLGILSILKEENVTGIVTTTTDSAFPFPTVYRNPQRQQILQICGWNFDANSPPSLEECLLRFVFRFSLFFSTRFCSLAPIEDWRNVETGKEPWPSLFSISKLIERFKASTKALPTPMTRNTSSSLWR